MKPHLRGRKGQKPKQSPLPLSIDMETILSVLEWMLDHPGDFFIPPMQALETAETIVEQIDPDLRFLHLPDPRTRAVITAIARVIEAQKIINTLPESCKFT